MKTLKNNFVRGILVLVPCVITIYVLKSLFVFCDSILGPYVFKALDFAGGKLNITFLEDVYIPGLGIVLLIVIIYITGVLAKTLSGKWFTSLGTKIFKVIPGVTNIYNFATHLVKSISTEGETSFKKVVLVEIENGAYGLGLVTGEADKKLYDEDSMLVFMPGSPNPLAGSLLVVKKDRIKNTNIPAKEALKLLVSGGIGAEHC